MARPKDIGTEGERAVVTYLRSTGWPFAERRALAGVNDLGDVTGTPGIVWEVKAGRTAERAGDGLVADWLIETETERRRAGAVYGVLVTKRPGYGPGRAAAWWAHLDVAAVLALMRGQPDTVTPVLLPADLFAAPVRMHLATAVALLRAAGYGIPHPAEEDP